MKPTAVLLVVLAVFCHAMRSASCQSAAPNQQTGTKPLFGVTVNMPDGEQVWPVQSKRSRRPEEPHPVTHLWLQHYQCIYLIWQTTPEALIESTAIAFWGLVPKPSCEMGAQPLPEL